MRGLLHLFSIVFILNINGLDETVSAETCTPGKARLVNGTYEHEGVLEICTENSTWSTICYKYFSCNELTVACRQAGYDEGRSYYTNYTRRLDPPKLGFYSCRGTENSLSQCSKRIGLTIANNCGGLYALGLKCSKTPDDSCTTQNAVRLFGGTKRSEGQLQICRNQKWRDVCDGSGDSQALGYIACRELGYTGNWVSTSHNRHYYNATTVPSFYTRIICYNRNYAKTSYCSIYEGCHYQCFGQETAVTCEIEKTNCKEREVRLSGGHNALEGWVEICVDGIWGRTAGKVEGRAKDLICSQMGFNETGAIAVNWYTANRNYKSVNSPFLVNYINCCDRDKTFQTCDIHYAKVTDSLSRNHLFALRCIDGCTNGAMRLTGGGSKHEGIVEMCVGSTWRALGLTNWDDTDANVVCQHLYPGQKYAYAVATNSSEFVKSARDVYYDNLQCNGAEMSTLYCARNTVYGSYTSEYTAAVKCHPVCDCKQ